MSKKRFGSSPAELRRRWRVESVVEGAAAT
ncbi:hypothetical protein BJ958_003366 [Nocardioides kongjuensis]|uniref:Uncharacterized protein n=1 Tax=Nocardioides kongjuensis TaxID=349522 RepID=A0A852RSG9_9ACTN|nr:hypothetical protein [Nocardioides kongjuensis]